MDQRQTFEDSDQLFSFITEVFQKQQPASLLIDKDGLERVEGVITAIDPHIDVDKTRIIINDIVPVLLKEIIGINGLFRSDYSEC
jgi:hypothetical protein